MWSLGNLTAVDNKILIPKSNGDFTEYKVKSKIWSFS